MADIATAGIGKPGYCKLCSFQDPRNQDDFDQRTGMKENGQFVYSPAKLNEWLQSKGLDQVNRQTIYSHRKHVAHPKDRIVSAVQKRTLEHGVQPATVSEHEFLDSLITLGRAKIAADPSAVTIDQALKATQIKLTSGKKSDGHQTLVAIFTNTRPPIEVIEGEVREL